MKKLKIANLICVCVALVLEILPFSVRMKWADFFYENSTYHSYFDLTVWGYGDMGPFLCGIFTIAIIALLAIWLFKEQKRAYSFALCAVGLVTVMLSIVPAFFDSYTLFGLIITVLLSVSTEMSILTFLDYKKNK